MTGRILVLAVVCLYLAAPVWAHSAHQHAPAKEERPAEAEPAPVAAPEPVEPEDSEHDEHAEYSEHEHDDELGDAAVGWSARRLVDWLGRFHPVAVHFPIALILMAGLAEWMFARSGSAAFDAAARFMIRAGAMAAIPAALLGVAYGYGEAAEYDGILADFFWWHRLLGLTTAGLAVAAVFLRERIDARVAYRWILLAAVISVSIAGYLGGGMTYGPKHLLP